MEREGDLLMPRITVKVKGASRTVRYILVSDMDCIRQMLKDGICSGLRFSNYRFVLAAKTVNQSTLRAVAKRLGA